MRDRELFDRILATIDAMEENQHRKVVDLARRLKPNLTAEDIQAFLAYAEDRERTLLTPAA